MSLLRATIPLIAAAFLLPSTPASAQVAVTKKGKKVRREGEYRGVKPGNGAGRVRGQRSKRPTLTWVGFQPREAGSSRFFVQLNSPAEYQQSLDDKNVLHVWVKGVRFGTRNVQRRLDTRFFDTPVGLVKSRRVRKRRRRGKPAEPRGVRLDFTFKDPVDAAQAQISASKGQDGFHYIYLDFGPAKDREDTRDERGDDDVAP